MANSFQNKIDDQFWCTNLIIVYGALSQGEVVYFIVYIDPNR